MKMRRGDVGLADLAEALNELPIEGDAQLQALGRCLGLSGLRETRNLHRRGGYEEKFRHRHNEPLPKRPGSTGTGLPKPPPRQPDRPPHALATDWSEETGVAPEPVARPDYLEQPEERPKRPRPRAALFPRPTASGVLGAAAVTPCPGRELDMPALIGRIVAGRPLVPLPTVEGTNLSQGAQLVLDRCEPMTPFFPDQSDLVKALETVVGETRLEVYDYLDHPRGARRWLGGGREKLWRPRRGRPVLFATDLGLGAGVDLAPTVSPAQWRALVRSFTQDGIPVVFLVPLPPGDWPGWLDRSFNPVHWDPRTRAETVRSLIGG